MSAPAEKEKSPVELFWETPEYKAWSHALGSMIRTRLNPALDKLKELPPAQAERAKRAMFDINPDAGLAWQQATQGPMLDAQQAFAYAVANDQGLITETEALLREGLRLSRKIAIINKRETAELTATELDASIERFRTRVVTSLKLTDALQAVSDAVDANDADAQSAAKTRLIEAAKLDAELVSEKYRPNAEAIDRSADKYVAALVQKKKWAAMGVGYGTEEPTLHSVWSNCGLAVQRENADRDRNRRGRF